MPNKKTTTKGKRSPAKSRTTDRKVIIRTYSAGVHFGTLVSRSADGTQATLRNARRCFRFQIDHKRHRTSQVSCSELAVFGPFGDSKIAVTVPTQDLVGVIEVLDASKEAISAIEGWPQ